jgi:hypothetical protein
MSALQGKDPEFWKFHRESLASINDSLNIAFMTKWIHVVLFDHIGNPKRTWEFLWPRRERIFAACSRFIGPGIVLSFDRRFLKNFDGA